MMSKFLIKKAIFGGFLVVPILSSLYVAATLDPSFKAWALFGIMMAFSLVTIFSFLLEKEMHMGGFSLKPEDSKELRIFFFLGAIVFWFISLSYLFSQ